jgi:hypothetical protein
MGSVVGCRRIGKATARHVDIPWDLGNGGAKRTKIAPERRIIVWLAFYGPDEDGVSTYHDILYYTIRPRLQHGAYAIHFCRDPAMRAHTHHFMHFSTVC